MYIFTLNYTQLNYIRNVKRVLLLLFGIFLATKIFPQISYEVENNLVEDGLSQGRVQVIIQDSSGMTWIGTKDGLNRYDGYEFKVFKHNGDLTGSVSGNNIQDLVLDKQGRIWIAILGGGLNCLDPLSLEFKHYMADSSLCSNNIISLFYDEDNNFLWLGSWDAGLQQLDLETGKFKRFPSLMKDNLYKRITAIYRDSRDNLWIGYGDGYFQVFSFDENNNIKSIQDFDDVMGIEIHTTISDILEFKGKVLLGTFGNGIIECTPYGNGYTIQKMQLTSDSMFHVHMITALMKDHSKIWMGDANGLFYLDTENEKITEVINPYNNEVIHSGVLCLYKDNSGIIWAGSNGKGISKVYPKLKSFTEISVKETADIPLMIKSVRTIYEDENKMLYVGGYFGFNKINLETGALKKYNYHYGIHEGIEYPQLSNINIYNIHPDPVAPNKYLWLGTEGGGLIRFDKRTELFTYYRRRPSLNGDDTLDIGGEILCVVSDDDDYLWFGSEVGVTKMDPVSLKAEVYSYNPQKPGFMLKGKIRSMFYAGNDLLYIGSDIDGMAIVNTKTGRTKKYIHYHHDPKSISDNCVNVIFKDSKGRFWIGTSSGLNVFDPGKELFHIPGMLKDIKNNYINGILEDDSGLLWFSTNRGIYRYDEKNSFLKHFEQEDGLPGTEFNQNAYFKNKNGQLFFGGVFGLCSFNPKQIKQNNFIPPIVITSMRIFGEEVFFYRLLNDKKQLRLSHKQNLISLNFSALNYRNTKKNQYKYKLEGFSDKWIGLGNKREINFINLDPGEYTLWIKGSNDDGIWNEDGLKFDIVIIPPLIGRTWFQGFLLMVFVFLVLFLNRWRIRNVENQNKRLEKEVQRQTLDLKESELKFRNFSEMLPETVLEFDKDLSIEFINHFAAKKFLYNSELEIKSLKQIIHPDFHQKLISFLKDFGTEPEFRSMEINAIRKDKTVFPAILYANPYFDKNKLLGFRSILLDISVLKQTQKNLRLAKEDTERANRFKSIFLANMSHEIRTPLNAVLGFTDLLNSIFEKEPQKTYLDNIAKSGRILLDLINDILDLSKIESGRLTLKNEPSNLVVICDEVRDIFSLRVKEKGIAMNTEYSGFVNHTVLIDEIRIKQIIINLVNNAIKFTDEGYVNIRVDALQKKDKNFLDVFISIEDSGSGISEEMQEKVFDLFIQAENVQRMKLYSGSGLGLTITKALVELMGGKVSVESRLQVGSTFKVFIPDLEIVKIKTDTAKQKTLNPKEINFEKSNVLLADDVGFNRKLIRAFLDKSNVNVIEAEDGQIALEMARKHKPDVILMDIRMPVMDGIEATRLIKKDRELSKIPVIAITAHALKNDGLNYEDTGFDGYLYKPVNMTLLFEELMKYLKYTRK